MNWEQAIIGSILVIFLGASVLMLNESLNKQTEIFRRLNAQTIVIGKMVQVEEAECKLLHQVMDKLEAIQVRSTVTAYCPCALCCGIHSNGLTSRGIDAYKTGIAVDPRLIPYGTQVYIPGAGWRVADDTGGAMRKAGRRGQYHIDLRFPTHKEALQWGRKNLKVRLLTKPKCQR